MVVVDEGGPYPRDDGHWKVFQGLIDQSFGLEEEMAAITYSIQYTDRF